MAEETPIKKIRKYVIKTKQTSGAGVNTGYNWWAAEANQLHSAVFAAVDSLTKNQSVRVQNLLRQGRLYSNKDLASFIPGQVNPYGNHRLTFNVCRSCTDTANAKIAKNNIRPLFLTTKGDYKQQRRAKLLTQYIQGSFDDTKAFELQQKAFLHASIYDVGIVQVWPDKIKGQPKIEVVHPHEFLVDEIEAATGSPRSTYRMKLVPRSVLLGEVMGSEAIENKAEKIKLVENATSFTSFATSQLLMTDLLPVVEAFHLPSVKGADDGRHVICLQEGVLFEEAWENDFFPYVFHYWNKSPLGFYGEGLVSQLVGIQLEINLTVQRIQESMELFAVPRIFVETSSQVMSSMITNEIGTIIPYTGTPPVFSQPTAANPEIYAYLENLVQKAYQMTGISELSAQSQKPVGLDSGKALRTFQDIETERFAQIAERWQESFIDLAKLYVWASRELYKDNSKLSVSVKGRDFIKQIKWSEVNLEDDKFVIDCSPTSILPSRPEAKYQAVSEMYQMQWLDKDEAMSLLDFPDLEAYNNIALAAMDDLKFVLEELSEGRYIAPEPYMKLDAGIKMMNGFYLRSRSESVPDDIRELALTWISQAQEIVQQAQMEAMQQQVMQAQASDPQGMQQAQMMQQEQLAA